MTAIDLAVTIGNLTAGVDYDTEVQGAAQKALYPVGFSHERVIDPKLVLPREGKKVVWRLNQTSIVTSTSGTFVEADRTPPATAWTPSSTNGSLTTYYISRQIGFETAYHSNYDVTQEILEDNVMASNDLRMRLITAETANGTKTVPNASTQHFTSDALHDMTVLFNVNNGKPGSLGMALLANPRTWDRCQKDLKDSGAMSALQIDPQLLNANIGYKGRLMGVDIYVTNNLNTSGATADVFLTAAGRQGGIGWGFILENGNEIWTRRTNVGSEPHTDLREKVNTYFRGVAKLLQPGNGLLGQYLNS